MCRSGLTFSHTTWYNLRSLRVDFCHLILWEALVVLRMKECIGASCSYNVFCFFKSRISFERVYSPTIIAAIPTGPEVCQVWPYFSEIICRRTV